MRQHDSDLVGIHFSIALQAPSFKHCDQGCLDDLLTVYANGVEDEQVLQEPFVCRHCFMVYAPFEIQTLLANEWFARCEVLEHGGTCAILQSSRHSIAVH